jgi:hypothetical protein
MSQSLVASGGATMWHPLVMKGSIFFNETLRSPSGEWIEHVWTLFGVKQGIWNFGKSWAGAPNSSDPRQSHGEAILYLICYLKKTRDLGLKFTPDPTEGFECYCDSDFSGLWNKEFAPVDPSTAKSRSGWIIFYAGCPVSWASKLQSQVALSTTEAEYIAMSQALRDIIPVMNLLQEMREREFQVICNEHYV